MPIGTLSGLGNTSQAANASSVTFTVPTCSAGDFLHLFVSESTGTNTIPTPPTGWTLQDGPVDDGANTLRGYWFRKVAVAGDSGASVTVTWNGSGRIAGGILKVPGASGFDITQPAVIDATADGQIDLPAITPTANDTVRVVLILTRYAAGTAGAMSTVPTGFTKHFDVATSNASNPRLGAIAISQQLTGQAGVTQGAVSGFYNNSVTRNTFWQFTMAPVATASTPANIAVPGAAASAAATAPAVTAGVVIPASTSVPAGAASASAKAPAVTAGVVIPASTSVPSAAASTASTAPGIAAGASTTPYAAAASAAATPPSIEAGSVISASVAPPAAAALADATAPEIAAGVVVPADVAPPAAAALADATPPDVAGFVVISLPAGLAIGDATAPLIDAETGAPAIVVLDAGTATLTAAPARTALLIPAPARTAALVDIIATAALVASPPPAAAVVGSPAPTAVLTPTDAPTAILVSVADATATLTHPGA